MLRRFAARERSVARCGPCSLTGGGHAVQAAVDVDADGMGMDATAAEVVDQFVGRAPAQIQRLGTDPRPNLEAAIRRYDEASRVDRR
jgi:hypothetical protein